MQGGMLQEMLNVEYLRLPLQGLPEHVSWTVYDMCDCMYVFIYVCMHIYMYVCVWSCRCRAYLSVCRGRYVAHWCVCVCFCVYVWSPSAHVYTCIHTHTHTHIKFHSCAGLGKQHICIQAYRHMGRTSTALVFSMDGFRLGTARASSVGYRLAYGMYACMYVCMYVSMYVCIYVCMYACMHVCI